MQDSAGDGSFEKPPSLKQGKGKGVLVHGDLVREGREALALSQEKFAERYGLTPKQIRRIETDDSAHVQVHTLEKLASALGVAPRALIRRMHPPILLTTTADIIKTNIEIADSAKEVLYTTGHRSRDPDYFAAIERALEKNRRLVHYRILFGRPNQKLKEHLRGLLQKRNPDEFVDGNRTLGIALHTKSKFYPLEAAICLNESKVLFVLPSIRSNWNYDTALVFDDPKVIDGWRLWVEVMFKNGVPFSTADELDANFEQDASPERHGLDTKET